jgi:hypothetical protein
MLRLLAWGRLVQSNEVKVPGPCTRWGEREGEGARERERESAAYMPERRIYGYRAARAQRGAAIRTLKTIIDSDVSMVED